MKFKDVIMQGANLSNTSFKTKPSETNGFDKIDLQNANFSFSQIESLDFEDSNLTESNFLDAELNGINLANLI